MQQQSKSKSQKSQKSQKTKLKQNQTKPENQNQDPKATPPSKKLKKLRELLNVKLVVHIVTAGL